MPLLSLKIWWSVISNRQLVRRTSLLAKDNWESPPLALVQPTTNRRTKDKYWRLRAVDKQKVSALEENRVE